MKNKKIAVIGLTGQSIFLEVDEFHNPGETIQAKSVNIEPGGKGYNQAIACARLGMDVSYLTAVGIDSYAIECEKYMVNEKIKTYYFKKEDNSAIATILTNKNGDNQVTVYKGASEKLQLDDLEVFKKEIETSDILLVNNEIPYSILSESIKYAKQNNVYVILNPAPAIYNLDEILPYVDLLIPNESEANQIFNNDINNIKINSDLKLIITLGSKGCLYIDKDNKKYYDAKKVNVVDTTGAGDVFCAAVSSQILNKKIEHTINFATIASSIHIQRKYVMEAIPKLYEIEKECH